MATKVYNINAIRPALVRMRENGNRGVISKSLCNELGITENYFTWYKASLEKLFEAVCAYCRLKNSPTATKADVDAALEAIYPLWKDMLSTAEKDKFTKELRVTEHDISNLVSFCQIFVNDKNDLSRGTDDNFVTHKVWAVQPLKQFQKRVETDLGIRIAQIEVLSDTERDFLRAEGKILSKWKKAERRIADLSANKEKLMALSAKVKGAEAKGIFKAQIEEIDESIKVLNEKIEGCKKAHYELLNPETKEEKSAEVATPKAAATTKKTKKAKSTTKEVLVAKS